MCVQVDDTELPEAPREPGRFEEVGGVAEELPGLAPAHAEGRRERVHCPHGMGEKLADGDKEQRHQASSKHRLGEASFVEIGRILEVGTMRTDREPRDVMPQSDEPVDLAANEGVADGGVGIAQIGDAQAGRSGHRRDSAGVVPGLGGGLAHARDAARNSANF